MIYFERGSEHDEISPREMQEALYAVFDKLGQRDRVLILPPDFTRRHSMAGELTTMAYNYYRDRVADILPALGTHPLPLHDRYAHGEHEDQNPYPQY